MGTTVAGLEGVVAGESEICYIDGYAGILSYRGYNIHTLADHASFEEVIILLSNGPLPQPAEMDQLKTDHALNAGIPTALTLTGQTPSILTTFDPLPKALPVIGGDPGMSFAEIFLSTLTVKRPE